MIPDTTYGLVIFSRPLVTSDDNDQNLDQPLYLHFSFGEFIVNSSFPIGDPGDNRWISRRPIQFDCSLNCKHPTTMLCCAVCAVLCVCACVCVRVCVHVCVASSCHTASCGTCTLTRQRRTPLGQQCIHQRSVNREEKWEGVLHPHWAIL